MSNSKNSVFSKLYRYYCNKLLTRIGVSLLGFLYFSVILIFLGRSSSSWVERGDGGTQKLALFGSISLIQLVLSYLMNSSLIGHLVGRESGGGQLRQRKLFSQPGISKQNDIGILLYTPGVDRKTIIYAKFAAAFTYFMAINFSLCALLTVYFLVATNLGAIAALSFLLLNGLFFGLVNFCFIVPFLFYQQEGGSWLVYLLIIFFFIFLNLVFHFLVDFIHAYPLVFGSLSIPLFLLTGYFFFSLYRKKILTQDLS